MTGGKSSQIYIPTPETVQSSIPYDLLYPPTFSQPATYIRFSSTVEDCSGCPYNLSHDDLSFLNSVQGTFDSAQLCAEDEIEELMYFFEETSSIRQAYASVDDSPVVGWDEMESALGDASDGHPRHLAKLVYEHWRTRRSKNDNRRLTATLKFETGVGTDDGDPYVCFRRREVRQIRKTRGRDAQSVEKLKKLRKELEDSRQLISLARQRELTKRELLSVDRRIFEQRAKLRTIKKELPEHLRSGDEDLLINQKVLYQPNSNHPRQSADIRSRKRRSLWRY